MVSSDLSSPRSFFAKGSSRCSRFVLTARPGAKCVLLAFVIVCHVNVDLTFS
jgi:hypothetical protein